MIKELSEFGRKKRIEIANGQIVHDSLVNENIDIIISISKEGYFKNLYPVKRKTIVEDVIRTEDKGRTSCVLPRLLVDNSKYALAYPKDNEKSIECHQEYLNKLRKYPLKSLEPIIAFYSNENDGVDSAYTEFDILLKSKQIKDGNIAFLIFGEDRLVNENSEVLDAIKMDYEKTEKERMGSENLKCSICGSDKYRTINVATHGVIKRVPNGQKSGCTLVTYNADSFESYGLEGNNNSLVCTNCIKNYIEGLNWLLTDGRILQEKDKKGRIKDRFVYSHRKDFGTDTAMIYWTRENADIAGLDILDRPTPGLVANMIDSVTSGRAEKGKVETNRFYSCTLSGVAARIVIRDWIEINLRDFQNSIVKWFKDIAIEKYDWDLKKSSCYYSRLYEMAKSGQDEKAGNDTTLSRIASHIWNAALKNSSPPLWILSEVIKRIRVDDKGITPERAALIKLILNRNNKGGPMVMEKLDSGNNSTAYVCGQIFAEMESIQRAALGKNLNAGIRERFFSSASLTPATAFGRLARLSNQHLTKLRVEKPGLFIALDKELGGLMTKIKSYPAIFTLEEQGQFAIGYYHQQQALFSKAKEKPELLEAMEPD